PYRYTGPDHVGAWTVLPPRIVVVQGPQEPCDFIAVCRVLSNTVWSTPLTRKASMYTPGPLLLLVADASETSSSDFPALVTQLTSVASPSPCAATQSLPGCERLNSTTPPTLAGRSASSCLALLDAAAVGDAAALGDAAGLSGPPLKSMVQPSMATRMAAAAARPNRAKEFISEGLHADARRRRWWVVAISSRAASRYRSGRLSSPSRIQARTARWRSCSELIGSPPGRDARQRRALRAGRASRSAVVIAPSRWERRAARRSRRGEGQGSSAERPLCGGRWTVVGLPARAGLDR